MVYIQRSFMFRIVGKSNEKFFSTNTSKAIYVDFAKEEFVCMEEYDKFISLHELWRDEK